MEPVDSLESVHLLFNQICKILVYYFNKYIYNFPSLFWRLNFPRDWATWSCPTVYWCSLFIVLSLLFSLYFIFGSFYCYVVKLTNLSFAMSGLSLSHQVHFSYQYCIFSICSKEIWSFKKISSMSLLRILNHSYSFLNVCSVIIIIIVLWCSPDNSSISFSSELFGWTNYSHYESYFSTLFPCLVIFY